MRSPAATTFVLRRAQIASDRYGRMVAYAYTERDGDELFVQGDMIAAGYARVGDQVGSRDCAAALLARRKCRAQGEAWPVGRSVL